MQRWRRFLLPFSLLYGLIVAIRNYLFDSGRFKSNSYSIPIIGIGNLTTGGTGKTPHIEYLIRLLSSEFRCATISRGYGRKSKGFIFAELPTNTSLIGDEPMQYLTKFKDVTICVSENRIEAISQLQKMENLPQIILMDDSYQHRWVQPGINILLIEYDSIFAKDYLLPAGNLREPRSSIKRADVIIISKSPAILAPVERKKVIEHLSKYSSKPVFFTGVKYGEMERVYGPKNVLQMGLEYYREKNFTILLIAGIANPSILIEYLRRYTDKLEMIIYPDHHEFSKKDLINIQQTFDNIANPNKIIVTTEKDSMRFRNPEIDISMQKLPIFFMPIEVNFLLEEDSFKNLIKNYVRKNNGNN
jgi:tetraacyldisaccharide 4'-kinase